MFAAFDLTVTSADELRDLLRSWSENAAPDDGGTPHRITGGPSWTRRPTTPARRWGCPPRG